LLAIFYVNPYKCVANSFCLDFIIILALPLDILGSLVGSEQNVIGEEQNSEGKVTTKPQYYPVDWTLFYSLTALCY